MTSTLEPEESLGTDAVLSAVADEARRSVLRSLFRPEADGLSIETLVDRVIADVRPDGAGEDRRKRVRLALEHTHLPKLRACGTIDYDADRGRVRSAGDDLARDLVAVVESHEAGDR